MIISAFFAISVLQDLDFGKITIVHNTQLSHLVIPRGGNPYSNGQIHIITPGEPAELLLYDYPPYTKLEIAINFNSHIGSGIAGNHFVLKSLNYPSSVITNNNGEATLTVGATLENSINNVPYYDTTYASDWTITVSF